MGVAICALQYLTDGRNRWLPGPPQAPPQCAQQPMPLQAASSTLLTRIACRLSEEMAAWIGKPAASRPEITKFFWAYCKERGLQVGGGVDLQGVISSTAGCSCGLGASSAACRLALYTAKFQHLLGGWRAGLSQVLLLLHAPSTSCHPSGPPPRPAGPLGQELHPCRRHAQGADGGGAVQGLWLCQAHQAAPGVSPPLRGRFCVRHWMASQAQQAAVWCEPALAWVRPCVQQRTCIFVRSFPALWQPVRLVSRCCCMLTCSLALDCTLVLMHSK